MRTGPLMAMPGGEAFPFGYSKGKRSNAPQGLGQRGLVERSDTSRLAQLPYADIRMTDDGARRSFARLDSVNG